MTFFKTIEPIQDGSDASTADFAERIHRQNRRDYEMLDELTKHEILSTIRWWFETIILLLVCSLFIWFGIVTKRCWTKWKQTH